MKKAAKTLFVCQDCGYQAPKWMGRCPDCGQWHSLVEEAEKIQEGPGAAADAWGPADRPVPIDSLSGEDYGRLGTDMPECDRVLGGGLVPGSLVLIGGEPGIGKSTLVLQVLARLAGAGRRVLYVSGEESVRQIKLRSRRTGCDSPNLWVVSEIVFERIAEIVETQKPGVVALDSIQTLYAAGLTSAPGSVSQVREVTFRLSLMAKKTGIPVILVGHVTKEGAIAGPRLLEHMVDTVLYFEGDSNHVFRILRAVKNRFGSTNEIGVFEMKEQGLVEVPNPSAVFLSERPVNAAGSVVMASMEGSRPILIELQALATPTSFATPKRTVIGLDSNRVALLVAVLEKKVGIPLISQDIFMNAAGGVRVVETAADLAVACAIASSVFDRPAPERTVLVGEVGLAGEIRGVSHLETRMREAAKMGFDRIIAPETSTRNIKRVSGLELVGVRGLAQAIQSLF